MTSHGSTQYAWWKESVVYQIYPASFKDSNNDGIGDLRGIISKLNYIASLGVDVIWISPHYASPQVDMGYDISDYNDIYPPYGTMQDCDDLINEIHIRGMKVIFDLVINHTSDQHSWFQQSRSSKTDPKRKWYIWRPAKYDSNGMRHPPNNWKSYFGVPAWTWDEATEEYYLHLFAPQQPDLNWESKECREAIFDSAIRFWLAKGVDGFRVDTINIYSKVYVFDSISGTWELPDAPISEPAEDCQFAPMFFCNGPRMQEFLHELNSVFDQYDVMTVGELQFTHDPAQVKSYVSKRNRGLNMVFNFEAIQLGQTAGAIFDQHPFTPDDFKMELIRWQHLVGESDTWTTVFLENHDHPRSISRFGSDQLIYWEQSGKMLAIVLGSLSGTLFLYQGQEIGMINAPGTWPVSEYKDIVSTIYVHEMRQRFGDSDANLSSIIHNLHCMARDHARCPMQWDDEPHAGFCSSQARPWMRVTDHFRHINVAEQTGRVGSILECWKAMLKLRQEFRECFVYGAFTLCVSPAGLLVFLKTGRGQRSLTVANLTAERQSWVRVPDFAFNSQPLICNSGRDEDELEPFEARIYVESG